MNIKLEMNRITEKQIIGAVERLQIKDAGLDYLARIDTGARTTSLHAIDLEIEDDEEIMLRVSNIVIWLRWILSGRSSVNG
jgi:hypothetical protein